jgi:hypothetical protein
MDADMLYRIVYLIKRSSPFRVTAVVCIVGALAIVAGMFDVTSSAPPPQTAQPSPPISPAPTVSAAAQPAAPTFVQNPPAASQPIVPATLPLAPPPSATQSLSPAIADPSPLPSSPASPLVLDGAYSVSTGNDAFLQIVKFSPDGSCEWLDGMTTYQLRSTGAALVLEFTRREYVLQSWRVFGSVTDKAHPLRLERIDSGRGRRSLICRRAEAAP